MGPSTDSIGIDQTAQYVDTVKDAGGHVLGGQTVTWISSNTKIATVSPTGLVTTVSPGHDTVRAYDGLVLGQAVLAVGAGPLDHITVAPTQVNIRIGASTAFTATGYDAHNNPLSGGLFLWSSGNPKIATITTAGVLTGVAVGTDTVTASSGTVTAHAVAQVSMIPIASVSVSPPTPAVIYPTTVQLKATVTDSAGNIVSTAVTTWSSIPVGRVSTTGLVTPQLGDTTGGIKVTATSGGVVGTDQVTVKSPTSAITHLAFTPYGAPIVAGQVIAPPIHVQALDVNLHVVAGFTGNITVALGANPGAATLGGTFTRAAVAGIATFTDLVVNNPDTGYTLTATTTIAGTTILANLPFVVSPIPGQTGINYHGGSIVNSPKVTALYWSASQIYNGGPPPGTFGSPSADQSLIAFYLNHLGGSPLFDILATYYDGANTPIQNTVAYTQYWADSVAPPAVTGTFDLLTEVERGFASGALTYDSTTLYVVFSGTGVNLGGGFGTQYCAWHTAFQDSVGRLVTISAMPYNHDNNCSEYITAYGSPNNDPAADAEVNVLTHELAENTTDEYDNGWYSDSLGSTGEIGDLCAWNFGPGLGTDYNQVIGGKPFLVQMLWVNAETVTGAPVGCQQTWSTVLAASTRRIRMSGHIARRPPVLGRPHIFRPPSGVTLSRR